MTKIMKTPSRNKKKKEKEADPENKFPKIT